MSSTFIAGFDGRDGGREVVRFATGLARALVIVVPRRVATMPAPRAQFSAGDGA